MALNKTISKSDLRLPEVWDRGKELTHFMRRLLWRGERCAINGVRKCRWRIPWNKLWEYSRGLAYIPYQKSWRVLDFGGGASLPVYHLASMGMEVHSYDIDAHLNAEAQAMAEKHGWDLKTETRDLTLQPLPETELFDWAISYCVIEHLPKKLQPQTVAHLGSRVKKDGFLTFTFDYGPTAPVPDAIRTEEEVRSLITLTGMEPIDGIPFQDTGERYVLDKRYPSAAFTFGSLFLKKLR
jgi:hypothetical protein